MAVHGGGAAAGGGSLSLAAGLDSIFDSLAHTYKSAFFSLLSQRPVARAPKGNKERLLPYSNPSMTWFRSVHGSSSSPLLPAMCLSRHISNASFFVYDVSEILPHGQVGPRPERMEMQSASTNNEAATALTQIIFRFQGK